MNLSLAIVFAVIPLIVWTLNLIFSKVGGHFNLFKRHIILFYTDFIFVGFNLFFVLSVSFSWRPFFFIFPVCFMIGVINSVYFLTGDSKKKLFLVGKSGTILLENLTHALFFGFEATLIFLCFVLEIISESYFLIGLAFLLVYVLMIPYASKKINGRYIVYDKIYFWSFLVVLILIGVRFIYSNIYVSV
jgi:hypothetical protein